MMGLPLIVVSDDMGDNHTNILFEGLKHIARHYGSAETCRELATHYIDEYNRKILDVDEYTLKILDVLVENSHKSKPEVEDFDINLTSEDFDNFEKFVNGEEINHSELLRLLKKVMPRWTKISADKDTWPPEGENVIFLYKSSLSTRLWYYVRHDSISHHFDSIYNGSWWRPVICGVDCYAK